MRTRKLVLGAAIAAIGLFGFASVGLAVAQTGGGATPTPTETPSGPGGHMGDHGSMMGQMDQVHEQMQEAVAKALGLTVDQLNAQLTAGKTIPDIAKEKGVDMATVTAAMQAAHPAGGMMGDATTGTGCSGT